MDAEPAAPPLPEPSPIEASILSLTAARATGSICPSEVARALRPGPLEGWHPLLGEVRRAAVRLALAGAIEITRKGRPVDPLSFKGVVRLRTPRIAPNGDPV